MTDNSTIETGQAMNSVEVKQVSKSYTQGSLQVHALRGVSLAIPKGSFAALAGPSGSGKTTLLNIMGGLDRPDSGEVFVDGSPLAAMTQSGLAELRLRKIGFVFQAYNLIPVLSALENVEYVMLLQGVPSNERKKRAISVLREVGLETMIHRRPAELSGGQQQRVAVARAIVSEPAIILADEPTANLDSRTGEDLLGLMETMNREKQVTFIFSTHDPMVMAHARRLIHLKDGTIETDADKTLS